MKQYKILSLALLLALLIGLAAPAALAADGKASRSFRIESPEDLRQLAVDCAMDSYSDGLSVTLEADLDLSGLSIYPIPVFNGSFEGGGHSIRGFSPAGDGSYQGLFRYLLKDAVVQNLELQCSVEPETGRDCVGGLAGSSSGTVINVRVSGSVSGRNKVGGVVGENLGTISDCSFSGFVDGKRFTGGIAGYNEGLIRSCENSGSVNTSVSDSALSLEDIAGLNTQPLELLSAEDENVISDSGGIVGFSKGILMDCSNRGSVGYPHFGYNVGGVAGRQSGYLTDCSNYGEIFGRKDVAGIVGQMEPYLELVESANLAEEIVRLNEYMNAASGDLAQMSQELRDARADMDERDSSLDGDLGLKGSISHAGDEEGDTGGSIDGGSGGGGSISRPDDRVTDEDVDKLRDDLDKKADVNLPDDVDADRINALEDDLYNEYSGINDMIGIFSTSTGSLSEDLTAANDQFSRVMLLMSDALSGNTADVFDDVSETLTEKDVEGRVSRSENYGSVSGDSNVGGIAGSMGMEFEFDLEDSLTSKISANGIISNTYNAKCISSENVNRGAVLAKKDRAGGVSGSAEMGLILSCEGYGSVESTEGGYVGGVAGYSATAVRQSYAMCDLSGANYVGGIVGYGKEITDCASLISANDASAGLGAIAGWADMGVEGAVDRNVYVHEHLGAVDGISYAQRAMPVSYEQLIARPDVPDNFRHLRITYLVDGEIYRELSFAYGESPDPSQLPEVPYREGYSGHWSDYDPSSLRFNLTVEAIYTANQSTLASELTREDSPLSLVLLEGEFEDGVTMTLENCAVESSAVGGGTVLEGWTMKLHGMREDAPADYVLRYQAPESEEKGASVQIWVLGDKGWEPVETTATGSYFSFPAHGDRVSFCAVSFSRSISHDYTLYAALGGGAVLLLALALILRGRKKKKAPAAAAADGKE